MSTSNIVIVQTRKYNENQPPTRLQDSAEYENIVNPHRSQMSLLLKDKNKLTLYHECDTDACNLDDCPVEPRLYLCLKTYQKYLNSSLFGKLPASDIISFNNIYGNQQLCNDFLHIELQHTKYIPKLVQKYKSECECNDISNCKSFERNTRNRSNNRTQERYYRIRDNSSSSRASIMINNKDIIFQQECDKIHSFFLHSLLEFDNRSSDSVNIDKISNNLQINSNHRSSLKIRYIGKEDDKRWLNEYNPLKSDQENYESLIKSKYMGTFCGQNPYGFKYDDHRGLMHIKPKYTNIKNEVLSNTFHAISADNWNQTLRKSKTFNNSWAKTRIRAFQKGIYDDRIINIRKEWQKGQEITLREIVTLKLYTDFDKLQREMKKCFRSEAGCSNAQRIELEQRLMSFYHWRCNLLIVLTKFGRKINQLNKILYHGVNSKMLLNLSPTHAFSGPLSTTTSYHVAKAFASRKGMVLQLTSKYPKLEMCKAFDVSLISDYPEENEWLISFMYLRILQVKTRPILDKNNTNKYLIPIPSQLKEIFFAIHLFQSQIFCMSKHLENIVIPFIDNKLNGNSIIDSNLIHFNPNPQQDDQTKYTHSTDQILRILSERFNETLNKQKVVKLDEMSDGLKKYFFGDNCEYDDENRKTWTRVSLNKITLIFPNVQEIHFLNKYKIKFDHASLKKLIDIGKPNNKLHLKRIKFTYYEPYQNSTNYSSRIKNNCFSIKSKDGASVYHQISIKMRTNIIKQDRDLNNASSINDTGNIKHKKCIEVILKLHCKLQKQDTELEECKILNDFLVKKSFNDDEDNLRLNDQLAQQRRANMRVGHNHATLINHHNQLHSKYFEERDNNLELANTNHQLTNTIHQFANTIHELTNKNHQLTNKIHQLEHKHFTELEKLRAEIKKLKQDQNKK